MPDLRRRCPDTMRPADGSTARGERRQSAPPVGGNVAAPPRGPFAERGHGIGEGRGRRLWAAARHRRVVRPPSRRASGSRRGCLTALPPCSLKPRRSRPSGYRATTNATIGLFSLIDAAEPKNLASPKLKTPPSVATSQ